MAALATISAFDVLKTTLKRVSLYDAPHGLPKNVAAL